MKLYYFLKNKISLLAVPAVFFALASCSSYQYSGYEADGIYGESRPGILEQQEPDKTTEVRPNNNNSYYKNLFAQQSEMVGEALESEIFTDVEDYTSNDGYENYSDAGGDIAYVGGNAPWGDDPDSYTINIYNNGFYGGFYSPWRYGWAFGSPYYYGGWYDPYWPGYWGGFYGPYGYGPYAYGYGRSYWHIGFGFGYGYGYRGYYPYRHHYYPFYNNYRDHYAYNTSRRNSRTSYDDMNTRRNSYSRNIREIRNSRSSDYGTSRVRRSVSNDDNNQMYTRSTRRSQSPVYGRSRDGSPTYQRSSQSNNRTYRSSAPTSRSSSTRSGTVRSSSSSSRSSGSTTRSSGSSSRSGRTSRGGGR